MADRGPARRGRGAFFTTNTAILACIVLALTLLVVAYRLSVAS